MLLNTTEPIEYATGRGELDPSAAKSLCLAGMLGEPGVERADEPGVIDPTFTQGLGGTALFMAPHQLRFTQLARRLSFDVVAVACHYRDNLCPGHVTRNIRPAQGR